MFRADGRTDMMKLIFAFRNFPNAPSSSSCRWDAQYTAALQMHFNGNTSADGQTQLTAWI
jgi:hypothetical protein